MTKHLHLKQVLATLLIIAAVFAGQQAFATVTETITIKGQKQSNGNISYFAFEIQSIWGGASLPGQQGSSYTFNNTNLPGGMVTLNGTLNFQEATQLTDVVTGSTFTVTVENSEQWFYSATVKTLSGTTVTDCSVTVSDDQNTITVSIPSGKTFGQIILDYVTNEPFNNNNTVIGGIESEYIYTGSPIEPVPTVTYNGTVLTAGTDYTVSYANNNALGTATLTVTGTGQYAGTVTRNYNIRAVALSDFNSLGNNTYEIASTTDLDLLAVFVNLGNGCQGLTFKQTADITYSHGSSTTENNFTQIGGYFGGDKNFSGTYDGQNHTISGIRVYKSPTNSGNENKNVALFGRISGATIQNVILTDARITGYRYVGGLVGNKASGTVQNCLVVGSTITCGNTYGGALFGSNNGTLTANHYRNCTVNNTTNATNVGVGNGSSSNDMAGARSVHTLSLGQNVTATGESVAYQGTTYYACNTQITLGYNNLPAGYTLTYTLNGTALSGNTFTMPANDNATVTATLTLITYNITYDLDGGSVATANPATYNVTTPTFTLNNPTKAGYTFTGWTGSNGTTPQTEVTIAQGSTGNLNYTAQWSLDTYTITYDLDGGSVATANPTSYTVETPTFTLNNPTKVACNFDGWTGSNGDTPETTVTIAQGSTGDRSYTAQWTQYAFTLSLGTDITASGTVAFTYEGTDYFTPGTEITLAYGGTIPEGYRPLYSVNGNAIEGDTFEMPAADVVVDAVLLELERYYIYNSTTGELALLWGEFNKDNKWGSEVTESAVTRVTATDEVSFTGDCFNLFYYFTHCTSMDLNNVNTDNLTNIRCMFWGCQSLTTLNLSSWNTAAVTEMTSAFRNCTGLTSLNLSGWNTANVTNMSNMFLDCSSLQSLDLSGWNTANVTDMSGMFEGCSGLQSLDLSGWNTAKVTNMSGMFWTCSGLQSLDLSGWNTAKVTNMSYMFLNCSSLQSLDLSGWNTAKVTYMSSMFSNCSGLQSLDLSGWNTANVTNMSYMFPDCSSLQSLDLSGWNTANVTNMSGMFEGCSGLQSLNLTGWNTANVTDMKYMFYGCSGLQSLNVSGWNTANVTDMYYMFGGCSGLQSLNISGWNTANVTNMSGMFDGCSGLQSLDLTGWNTANVTNMSGMFEGCSGLQSLNLTGWNTANVTYMYYMFDGCSGLQSLNISGWNTARVTNMSNIFSGCSSLQSLDLSGWNTAKVTNMSYIFSGCSSLQSLDLSGWNTAKVTNMSYMFLGCTHLATIYVGEGWRTSRVNESTDMFDGCTSLVGGMGTAYDANHIDKEYARIDGGPDNPGYFTEPFTKEIAGYGNDENPGGYYLIASPVGTVNPENVGNMTANAFDLYRFNQSADLEWENWKAEGNNYHFDLEVGKGYLYANSEDVTLTFTGTLVEGDTYEVTLAKDNGATFAGWNLLGNPFADTAYIADSRRFYTMNYDGSEITPALGNSIAPMEGVFVIAETDGETMTFTTSEPNNRSKGIALNLSHGRGVIDRAIINFGQGQQLPKLQLRDNSTKIYITQDNRDYAVVHAENEGKTLVNFKAKENGTYTISVDVDNVEMEYLHLIDNLTGDDVDLLAAGPSTLRGASGTAGSGASYTFTAKTTDDANRFKLVFVVNNGPSTLR